MTEAIQEAKQKIRRRRGVRWHPKDKDLLVVKYWMNSCGNLNGTCFDCDSSEVCRDLAERLAAATAGLKPMKPATEAEREVASAKTLCPA